MKSAIILTLAASLILCGCVSNRRTKQQVESGPAKTCRLPIPPLDRTLSQQVLALIDAYEVIACYREALGQNGSVK